MLHLQVGSHKDESIILAQHLASLNLICIAAAHEIPLLSASAILFFQQAAGNLNLKITTVIPVEPLTSELILETQQVVNVASEAILYRGPSETLAPLAIQLTSSIGRV